MKATSGEEPVCGEAEARTKGRGRSFIERRLDATVWKGLRPARRRCAPRGVLRTRGGPESVGADRFSEKRAIG